MFHFISKIFRFFKKLAIFIIISTILTVIVNDVNYRCGNYAIVERNPEKNADDLQNLETKAEELLNNLLNPDKDSYEVTKVVDGDTFYIMMDGEEKKVRLIGVDTPESVHQDESRNCEEGKMASAFTKGLLNGQKVTLEFDISETDKYGRYLAYVYLEDGRMLQDILLENGMAKVMTVAPNVKYEEHFLSLQEEARKNEVGFWENYFK